MSGTVRYILRWVRMRSESGIWCVLGVSLVGDRRGSLVEAMPYFVRKNLIKTKGRRGVGASKKKNI